MKNYFGQTLGLTFLILLLLTGLSLVPEHLSVGGFELKKMDIFADIRSDVSVSVPDSMFVSPDTSSLFLQDSTGLALQDSLSTDSVGPLPPKDSAFFGKIITGDIVWPEEEDLKSRSLS